jgi:hypothetical protein
VKARNEVPKRLSTSKVTVRKELVSETDWGTFCRAQTTDVPVVQEAVAHVLLICPVEAVKVASDEPKLRPVKVTEVPPETTPLNLFTNVNTGES